MERCLSQGHVTGMLDRDQRTAKMCVFDRHVVIVTRCSDSPDQSSVTTRRNKALSHRTVPGRTSPHSRCKSRKNGHFWKSLPRLKPALFVSCLVLAALPGVLCAPTTTKPETKMDTIPKWYDPCGIGYIVGGSSGDAKNAPGDAKNASSKNTFANQIVHATQIAQGQANSFADKFANVTFRMDLDRMHGLHKNAEYDWLPTSKMDKKWKQPVSEEHLATLEYGPTLLNIYSDLQKLAVGMEQIVWDQEHNKSVGKTHMLDEFFAAQHQLNVLLCEVHSAILEEGLEFGENVPREIMNPELRDRSNETNIMIRNWIIYRDYMNMLEYVLAVFEHFKEISPERKSN